ncbi:hypothetical protein HMPREF0281_00276 [Corynebacterium ammoniagenes DSM 20306]|uniref:Uncharacterized protein n=1 Tax=Corynebacterium ammoniagenes DSM 20306 TaxID=649754 RepID=A0ABP2IGU3_CORAM|nr:hypothetical protein HMPREF0281_00276 [Corynebacterium ammoniagenes DSM 20306]
MLRYETLSFAAVVSKSPAHSSFRTSSIVGISDANYADVIYSPAAQG